MLQRYIVWMGFALMLGCARQSYPLDGKWTVMRDKTESQRQQRLGPLELPLETQVEWRELSRTHFEIYMHSQLNVRLESKKLGTIPIKVRELEPNLWMIHAQHAEQNFQIKAARVGDELRVLDAGHLFILEQR